MRKLGLFLLALSLMAVSFSTTIAQEELPGFIAEARTPCEVDLTGETFEFWHLGDLSGPFGFITQPVLAGFEDATNYFNERGGICGAQIVLPDATTVDTGGDQNQTQIIYDRISGSEPLMVVLYGSADSELLREQFAADEVTSLISAGSIEGLYGENADEPGWIFATNPLYVDQFGHFCRFVSENPDMYPAEPVVGYVSWAGAFGEAAYTPETIAYCESVGVNVLDEEGDGVGSELFLPTDSDISGAVQNLVDAGANILYTNSLASGPALVAATVANLGLDADVMVTGVNWSLDTSVGLLGASTLGGDNLPSVNGLVGSMPFAWWTETENPGIQLMTEIFNENERSLQTQNIAYILGFSTIDLYIETMVQTANAAGGIDFDGPEVYATLQQLDYNTLSILPVRFTNDAGEAIRDTEANRMALLTYAGADGGTVLDGQAPLIVQAGDQSLPVPVVVPLEEFTTTPDLRPGGADVPMMDGDG